jgi:hypothetical protein
MAICRSYKIATRFILLITLVLTLSSLVIPDLTPPTVGQTTKATISGRVNDMKGDVIPDTNIAATNLDNGVTRETTTDREGRYRLSKLTPGRYEIAIQHEGFRLYVQRGIDLTVGREAVIDVMLNVGDVQEKLTVEADASQVESTTSAVGYLVSRKQVESLPLNGRDVLQLATLQSGVTSTSAITFGQSELGGGATRLSINGGRIDFNAYY